MVVGLIRRRLLVMASSGRMVVGLIRRRLLVMAAGRMVVGLIRRRLLASSGRMVVDVGRKNASVTDVVCDDVIGRRANACRGLAGGEILEQAGFVLDGGVVLALAELMRHG